MDCLFLFARSGFLGLFTTLLFITGCVPLPDDEAAWVLEDFAVRGEDSHLKQQTPDPVRRSVTYAVQNNRYKADLYLPGEPALAGIVLVPGAAKRGKNDRRLVAFATTLARTRFLVLVPDLPNLRMLKIRAEDKRGVAGAFLHLLSLPEFPAGQQAGIGAFSYAVGPAVLAALEPAVRKRVDFVLGVGGYHDIHQVVTFFTTGYFQKQGRWQYLEPSQYGKWVFVLSNVERLPNAGDRYLLRTIARRKLNNANARVDDLRPRLTVAGKSVLDLLENRNPARTPSLVANLPKSIRVELDALNLANKDLSRLHARLILLHGTDDSIIPYAESVALATTAPMNQSELFLINGLAHVDVQPLGLDRRAMWHAIHAILAQRKRYDGKD